MLHTLLAMAEDGHGVWDARDTTKRAQGLDNVERAVTATDIKTVPFGVEKDVIRVSAGVGSLHAAVVSHGEHAEFGRIAKHRENLSRFVIERHRKIAGGSAHRPTRDLLSSVAIDHSDLTGIRDIDKNPAAVAAELKGLGMALQGDVGDLLRLTASMTASAPLP